MAVESVYSVLPTAVSDSGDLHLLLDNQERVKVLETVITQTARRASLVAAAAVDPTRACAAYSRQAKQLGAPTIMVSPPGKAKVNSDVSVVITKRLPLSWMKGLKWISV